MLTNILRNGKKIPKKNWQAKMKGRDFILLWLLGNYGIR